MFTSLDKALIAGLMAILSIVNLIWGYDFFGGSTEQIVGVIVSVLTPLLVYFTPNLKTT
jgi:hypothetical protein